MTDRVFDASAIIAFLRREPGADMVAAALAGGAISAVNLAEIVSWLVRNGYSDEAVGETMADLSLTVVPFDGELAVRSGLLERSGRRYGLSLGDRCCLALSEHLGVPVLTADRNWTRLKLGVEIALIR